MRYFLKLAYDGTPFHGWQRQPNASSVQQTIEEALSTVLRRRVDLVGAGRTDTGVHARQMFAHFDADEIADDKRLLTSLNRMVGHAVSIEELLMVVPDAHARFDATARSYDYRISLCKDPFDFRFSHRLDRIPDIALMNEAALLLLETKDFTSFAKLHSDARTNVCNVSHAFWTLDSDSRKLTFRITADRFLRNMVRAIVGTLLEVGMRKLSLEGFQEVILRKDRCEAGVSMPAKGLSLVKVDYPDSIFINP